MIGKLAFDFIQALQSIDMDTRLLVLRLLIRAGKSPSANLYLKEKIQKILDEEDHPPAQSPRQVNASWREVKK